MASWCQSSASRCFKKKAWKHVTWPHWSELSEDSRQTPERWFEAITFACERVAKGSKWNPQIYGQPLDWRDKSSDDERLLESTTTTDNMPQTWNKDLRDDLINDVYLCLLTRQFVSEEFGDIIKKLKAKDQENPTANIQDEFKTFIQQVVINVLRHRANQSDEQRLKKRFRKVLKETLDAIGEVPPHFGEDGNRMAYGLPGSSTIAALDNIDLGKARMVLNSFPVEHSYVDEAERQRAPRYFTDQTMSQIVLEIVRVLDKAITTVFLDNVIEHAFGYLARVIPTSLDKKQKSLANGQLSDRNASGGDQLPSHENADRQIVRDFVTTLGIREQAILAAVYGRWGDLTDQQIGDSLTPPVSRQRVDQIRKEVALKFRRYLRSSHGYLHGSDEELDDVVSNISGHLHRLLLEIDVSGAIQIGGVA